MRIFNKEKQKRLYLIISIFCVTFLVFAFRYGPINPHTMLKFLKFLTLVQSVKWTEVLFYFAVIYILSNLFFIPLGLPLNLFAGMLWGTLWGGLIVNILAAFVAAISFFIARLFSQYFLEHFFNTRYPLLNKLQNALHHHDWQFIFAARINPIIPFNISNYLFGLIPSLSFKRYILATILANLLPSFVFAAMGDTLQVFSLHNPAIRTKVCEVTLVFLLISLLLIVKLVSANKKAALNTHSP